MQKSPQYPDGVVQAHCSMLHGALNKAPINCAVHGKKTEKDFVLEDHLCCCPLDTVILYDRYYEDYAIIVANDVAGVDLLIRCKLLGSLMKVEAFAQSDLMEEIFTLTVPISQKILVRQHNWPESVRIRLVKVVLPTGETEVLLTSLLDAETYPGADFA